ncbi:MAG: hypothetical protein ACKOGP_03720 [Bacteroidota bacterium]
MENRLSMTYLSDGMGGQSSIPKNPFKEKYQDSIKETIDEIYSNPR